MTPKIRLLYCALLICAHITFGWNAGDLRVDVTKSPMNLTISAKGKCLAEVVGFTFGTREYTSISSVQEKTNALELTFAPKTTITITRVPSGIRMYGKINGADSVNITLRDKGEHFFGITCQNLNNSFSPDFRGQNVRCEVRFYNGSVHQHQVYSSFYMTSLGYASFFDSFAEGSYSFGRKGKTTITHTTNTIDWYIIYGPTGDKIHKAYYKIIEPPKKVPVWGCGPMIWNDNFKGTQQVMQYATTYTDKKIPLTMILVDRPYSNGKVGWSEMDFNAAFAHPAQWIGALKNEYNIRTITWVTPSTFGGDAPSDLDILDQVHNYYLDLSNPGTVAWYKYKIITNHMNNGISGHKIDRCEENFPVDSTWFDGTPKAERRAKFLYLTAKVHDEILRQTHGDDHIQFPRHGIQHCQQFNNIVWGGDEKKPWEGLIESISNVIKVGFLGFPMWGSNIGGYFTLEKMPEEQHLRWLSFGVFSGFMIHMLDNKEPWLYDEQFIHKFRKLYELRMDLLPYVYSLANNSATLGVIQRPLPYMYPFDTATYAIDDEYLFGPAMLVAPIYEFSTTRNVYLPEGQWINFWDYTDVQKGNSTITAAAAMDRIPVYIKANSVYVTGRICAGNMIKWVKDFDKTRTVTINAFPGDPGQNETFTYIDYLDKDSKKTITVKAIDKTNIQVYSSAPMTVSGNVMVYLAAAPAAVVMNGKKIKKPDYNSATRRLHVPFAANHEISLEVKRGSTKKSRK